MNKRTRSLGFSLLLLFVAATGCLRLNFKGQDQLLGQFKSIRALTYRSLTSIYAVGVPVFDNSPSSENGVPTDYEVSPALPAGLSLNSTTGVISGTPTTPSAATNYTITASNFVSTEVITLSIRVVNQGFRVDSTADTSPRTLHPSAADGVCGTGAGTCTIAEAIFEAMVYSEANPGDTPVVQIPAGTYSPQFVNELNDDTFLPPNGAATMPCAAYAGGPEADRACAWFPITQDVVIVGEGRDETVLDAQAENIRFFTIYDDSSGASPNVILQQMTLQNTDGTAVNNAGGGAISWQAPASGNLTIDQVVFKDLATINHGGAIYLDSANALSLTASRCVFENNRADSDDSGWGNGGAIYSGPANNFTISDCEFRSNRAAVGGAIVAGGGASDPVELPNPTFELDRTLLVLNLAGDAGAISLGQHYDQITITNSIFTQNEADITIGSGNVGAIDSQSSTDLFFNTIVANLQEITGAVRLGDLAGKTYRLSHNILAENVKAIDLDPANCALNGVGPYTATYQSLGWNLFDDNGEDCVDGLDVTDLEFTDPMLGTLTDNGGFFNTFRPEPGSPAIDSGDAACTETLDARRFERPVGNACDRGAFEVEPSED